MQINFSNNTINNGKATMIKPVDGDDSIGSSGGGRGTSASTGRTFTLSFYIQDVSGNTATIGSIQLSLSYTDADGKAKTVATERYMGVGGYKYNVLQISTSEYNENTDICLTVYVNGNLKYNETTQFRSNGLAWSMSNTNRFSSYTLYIIVPSVEQGIILPSIYRPFYTQATILINSGNTGDINFAIANGITYQEADGNFYLGDTTLMVDGKTVTVDKTWIVENATNNSDDSGIGEYDTSDLPSNSFQVQWVPVDKLNRGEMDQTVSDCPLYGGYYGFQFSYRTSSVFSPKDVIATIKYKFATYNFSYGAIEGDVGTAAAEKLRTTSPGTTTATCNINRNPSWKPITASTSEDRTWTVVTIDSITPSKVDGYTLSVERRNDGIIATYTIGENGSESGSGGGSSSDKGGATTDNNNLFRTENELYDNAVITCQHQVYSDTDKFDSNRTHNCTIEVTEGSPAGYSGTLMPKTISVYNSNARFYESIKVNGKVGTMKEEVTVEDESGNTTAVTITYTTFVCDIAGETSGVRYFAIPSASAETFSGKASKITPLDYENSDTWHSIHTKIGNYSLYQRELVEYYDSSLKSNQIRVKAVGDIADLKNGSVSIIGISDAFTALTGNGIESGNEYYNECKNPYTEVVPHTSFISFIKMY